jgi:choline dehydrogenase
MYDYIIIGAGSAGCLLANRLSASPANRVCLIEAGPRDTSPLIHVPLGLALLARVKSLNWNYDTMAEGALNGRRLFWPRGRVLGGSSSVNAMIYMRGHPDDYAGWAAAAGPAWGWDAVQPLFTAIEANGALGDAHHGTAGDVAVNDLRCVNPLSRAFVQAGVQAGHAENPDFNGAAQDGVGLYQVTQSNGARFSAAKAFLDPARPRPNLDILTGAEVDHVLLKSRRAIGVALADAAINSPQILLRSGIGPAADLAALGIAPVVDAPEVGANLADHLDVGILARVRGSEGIGLAPRLLPRAITALRDYITRRGGMLTSNVAEAGGFIKSDPAQPRPNIQLHFLPALLRDHGRKTTLGYGITLHICDLLPKSRGRITLASPRLGSAPQIHANYLSHPDDLPTLLAGLKLGRQILAAPALAQHITHEVEPGPAVQDDAALIDHIRAEAQTIYHPAGTARMGRDGRAVVDPAGRVNGAEGLRVVDASIMPNLVAGNTNAPTMMLAENIARMILAQG